jgi:type VI secretion system protein ImpA
MAGLDFAGLTAPLSEAEPCGPDLDLAGDPDYMNFVARAEGILPESFLSFDRASIDFAAELKTIGELLAATRDIRLLTIAAKLAVLNRDLDGFAGAVGAIAALTSERWQAVHPQGEDGDFTLRMVAVQSLDDLPTVVLPLQAATLAESRRFGVVSYRKVMVANGEAKAREGEETSDLTTIESALADTDLPGLIATRDRVRAVQGALATLAGTFVEQAGYDYAVGLERLPALAGHIIALLDAAIVKRDPSAAPPPAAAAAAEPGAAGGELAPAAAKSGVPVGSVASAADAARALAAVSAYFARLEPSSPAALLVHQAELCMGKSFLEVMRLLVPAFADKTIIPIGAERVFDLSIDQLKALDGAGGPPAAAAPPEEGAAAAPAVNGRADAIALLEQVGAFYRYAEPSSPIPLLTKRACELAERDFMSILQQVLPPETLRKITL